MVVLSTLIFSFSFATSKSISRIVGMFRQSRCTGAPLRTMPGCVECIVFVFGSKPFAVNDIVMIEGKPYTVVQIGA